VLNLEDFRHVTYVQFPVKVCFSLAVGRSSGY